MGELRELRTPKASYLAGFQKKFSPKYKVQDPTTFVGNFLSGVCRALYLDSEGIQLWGSSLHISSGKRAQKAFWWSPSSKRGPKKKNRKKKTEKNKKKQKKTKKTEKKTKKTEKNKKTEKKKKKKKKKTEKNKKKQKKTKKTEKNQKSGPGLSRYL